MKPVIQSLDHLVLTVADMDATCAFYQRVLGFGVAIFGGGRKALTFGSQKINLHSVRQDVDLKAEKPTPGSGDLCFLTDTPIEDVQRHLQTCGVAHSGATGRTKRRRWAHPLDLFPRS